MLRKLTLTILLAAVLALATLATLPATQATQDNCGDNEIYLKLCYYERSIHPYNPLRNAKAIQAFTDKAERNNWVEQGLLVITYTPEDHDKETKRLLKARERAITNTIEESTRAHNYRIVTGSYTKDAPGEHPRAVYIIPDIHAQNQNIPVIQDVAQNPPELGVARSIVNQEADLEEAWQRQWDAYKQAFTTDETLNELAQQIRTRTGISVFLVASNEEWDVSDEEVLNEHLRTEIQRSNIGKQDFSLYSDIFRDREHNSHPLPCANYLLLDPTGIKLYENTHCTLRFDPVRVQVQDPQEQAQRLLESALRNTQPLDEEKLFLSAYSIAEKTRYTPDGRNEAELLANWVAYTEFFQQSSQRQRHASKEIVLAKVALNEQNPQLALQKATENTQEAHTRLRPLGADVAIQAASRLNDCQELRRTIDRFSNELNRRSTTARTADNQLRDCQYRVAREQCQLVDASRHDTQTIADLEILYVNDGLSEEDFEEYTERITQRLLRTTNLDAHQQNILFRRAPSINPITQRQNELTAPRIDSRALQQSTNACYGDSTIVLSDNYYLPVTDGGGNAYISTNACRRDERCVSLYSLRGLAIGVFGLAEEEETATAPLNIGRGESSINHRISSTQQEVINDYFGANQ